MVRLITVLYSHLEGIFDCLICYVVYDIEDWFEASFCQIGDVFFECCNSRGIC